MYEVRGVRGRVVKVVDFKLLAPHRCGFESLQGLWIGCEETIQLAYGTSVVLLTLPVRASNNSWKGTLGLPPPVKLARRQMTCTVLV
jgi:hypothetical protein